MAANDDDFAPFSMALELRVIFAGMTMFLAREMVAAGITSEQSTLAELAKIRKSLERKGIASDGGRETLDTMAAMLIGAPPPPRRRS